MRARTVGAVAAAAVLVAAGVLAVQAGSPESVSAPEPVDYVALGDSFSAGPLVPDARSDPPGCFRSTNNYPAYLAGYLGVRSYRDVTCSGAQTRDLRRPQLMAFGQTTPPQLDALSTGTDLVTVGIGGNDSVTATDRVDFVDAGVGIDVVWGRGGADTCRGAERGTC